MAHRMLGAKIDRAKTPPPYQEIPGNAKLTDEMSIDGPKVAFLDVNQFADFQKCIKLMEEKYVDFGIVGVRPPPGASPPPMKFDTEGARAWGELKKERCVDSKAYQLYWKPAGEKPQEHVFQVSAMDCEENLSLGEFLRQAQLAGTFQPLATDMEDACDLFWELMMTSQARTEEEARNSLGAGTVRAAYAYAVDGSLFKQLGSQEGFSQGWNLYLLPGDIFRRTSLKHDPDEIIRGVHTPNVFLGQRATFFAGHFEDMNLLSLNYHFGGFPKVWYAVPRQDMAKFRWHLKSYLVNMCGADEARLERCDDFLRHKRFIIHPNWFRNRGIRLVRLFQQPGEYVVTFPYGYHFGFNVGFNVNEAVNFGTESWIDVAKVSGLCTCGADTPFDLSLVPFVAEFQPDRLENWLNGEDTKFPISVRHGGIPRVPKAPTFAHLVMFNLELTNRANRLIVEKKLRTFDRKGERKKLLMKRNEEKVIANKRQEAIDARNPRNDEAIVRTGKEKKHSLYCDEKEILATASEDTFTKYRRMLENLDARPFHERNPDKVLKVDLMENPTQPFDVIDLEEEIFSG